MYLSATKYSENLNISYQTFIAHVESEGWVKYGGKEITEKGIEVGIIYKFFNQDGNEVQYVAYPDGLISGDDVRWL